MKNVDSESFSFSHSRHTNFAVSAESKTFFNKIFRFLKHTEEVNSPNPGEQNFQVKIFENA